MPPIDMELKDLFSVRDALKTLCDYGYELNDMLDMVKEEIDVAVEALR